MYSVNCNQFITQCVLGAYYAKLSNIFKVIYYVIHKLLDVNILYKILRTACRSCLHYNDKVIKSTVSIDYVEIVEWSFIEYIKILLRPISCLLYTSDAADE